MTQQKIIIENKTKLEIKTVCEFVGLALRKGSNYMIEVIDHKELDGIYHVYLKQLKKSVKATVISDKMVEQNRGQK